MREQGRQAHAARHAQENAGILVLDHTRRVRLGEGQKDQGHFAASGNDVAAFAHDANLTAYARHHTGKPVEAVHIRDPHLGYGFAAQMDCGAIGQRRGLDNNVSVLTDYHGSVSNQRCPTV